MDTQIRLLDVAATQCQKNLMRKRLNMILQGNFVASSNLECIKDLAEFVNVTHSMKLCDN